MENTNFKSHVYLINIAGFNDNVLHYLNKISYLLLIYQDLYICEIILFSYLCLLQSVRNCLNF